MKKAFGLICSLLILVSSMGITISNHYCGNEFQKQSILGIPIEQNESESSCQDQKTDTCCSDESDIKNCCSSHLQIVEADIDLYKNSQDEISIDFGVIAEQFEYLFVESTLIHKTSIPIAQFMVQDRHVLFQSFLC